MQKPGFQMALCVWLGENFSELMLRESQTHFFVCWESRLRAS